MPHGHVFVVKGAIGGLVADAAVISTDQKFSVRSYWHQVVVGEGNTFDPDRHEPNGWADQGWGRDLAGQPLWFLDVTAAETGGGDAFDRLHRLLSDIANTHLGRRVKGRPLPLVVLPVIGTKGGGFGRERGTVVDRLLTTCQQFVRHHPIDVAIVAQNPASFAALQNRRRERAGTYFEQVDLDLAKSIGLQAREGSLALFIGAGASVPAGAPSWRELLEILAKEAQLDPAVSERFNELSALDQAQLLYDKLKERLGQTIKEKLQRLTPALSHVLLANLNCQSAVTTNYDRLYEAGVASSGDKAASILPHELPRAGTRWLLKMHGDVEDPNSIVLTRGQFVDFTGVSGPAGGVLQSLLLTKHMLVVGTSMKDDNFLRLIHEVASYRRRSQQRSGSRSSAETEQFGTIVAVEDDPARRELHRPYFDWRSMSGTTFDDKARQLEIFLDATVMYATGDHSWLLDSDFSFLLDENEEALAATARELASKVRQQAGDGSSWAALADQLDRFGARSRNRRSEVQ